MTYTVAYSDFWQLHNLGLSESELLNASTLVVLPPDTLQRVTHKTSQAIKQVASLDSVLQVSLLEPLLARAQEVFFTAPWEAQGSFAGATGALQYYLYSSHAGLMYYLSNAKKVNQARVVVEKPLSGIFFLVANLLVSYQEWSTRVQLRAGSWVYAPQSANLEYWVMQVQGAVATGWSGVHTGGAGTGHSTTSLNSSEVTPVSTHCKITYQRDPARVTAAQRDVALLQHYLQVLVPPAVAASLTAIFPEWRKQVLDILTGKDEISHLYNSLTYAQSTALRIGEQQLQIPQQRVLLQNYRKEFALNRKEITQQVSNTQLATSLPSYLRQQVAYWQLQQELLVPSSAGQGSKSPLTYGELQLNTNGGFGNRGSSVQGDNLITHQNFLTVLHQSTLAWQTAQVLTRLNQQARHQQLHQVLLTAPALQQHWQQGQELLTQQLENLEQMRERLLRFAQGERELANVLVELREEETERELFAQLAAQAQEREQARAVSETAETEVENSNADVEASEVGIEVAEVEEEQDAEIATELGEDLEGEAEADGAEFSWDFVTDGEDATDTAIANWDVDTLAHLNHLAQTELGWGVELESGAGDGSDEESDENETGASAAEIDADLTGNSEDEELTLEELGAQSQDQEIQQRLASLLHRYTSEVQHTQQLIIQHQTTEQVIQRQRRRNALATNLQEQLSRVNLSSWASNAETSRKNHLRNLLRKEDAASKLEQFSQASLGIFLAEVIRQIQAREQQGVYAIGAVTSSADGVTALSNSVSGIGKPEVGSGVRHGELFYPNRSQLKQHAQLLRQAQGVVGEHGMEQMLEQAADDEEVAQTSRSTQRKSRPTLSYLHALQLTVTDRKMFTQLYQQEMLQGVALREALHNLVERFSWFMNYHREQAQDIQAAVSFLQQRQQQLRERAELVRMHEQELRDAQRELEELREQVAHEQEQIAQQAESMQEQLEQLHIQNQTLSTKLTTLTNNQLLWSELRQREMQLREQLLVVKRQEVALLNAEHQADSSNHYLELLRQKVRGLEQELNDTNTELSNLRYDYFMLVEQLQMVQRYFEVLEQKGVRPREVLIRMGVEQQVIEQIVLPKGVHHD